MSETTPQIRKVQTSLMADFDDQLWPINVAILILAGFVAGIVVATSDFDDARILYNGWVRLGSVALMTLLLFLGVMYLQGKMLRRLQLCILISLLLHLWLVVYLHDQYLALLAEREKKDETRVVQNYEELTIPEYRWEQIDNPESRQDFEEPIEHEAPKPADPDAVRREAEEPPMSTQQEAVTEPETPQQQQPNPAVTERIELSAPRRADAAAGAQVSRQEWKHRPTPNEPIPEPEVAPQPRDAAAAVLPEARIAPRQREQKRFEADQRQTFEELASAQSSQAEVRMARRADRPEPLPDTPTTPTPTRQLRNPSETPRTEALAPEPVKVAQQPTEAEVRPEPLRVSARRQADAPRVVRPSEETVATAPPSRAVAVAAARHQSTDQAPQVTEARQAVPSRRPREVATPRDADRPQTEEVAATAERSPELNPANLRVPDRATAATAPASVKVLQQASQTPAHPAPSALVQNSTRRETASQPATASRTARPSRTASPQETDLVPTPEIALAAVASETPLTAAALPIAQPNAAAVNRSADSPRQVPQAESPGRALPALTAAPQLPSTVAARRASPTQQLQPSTDAAPSRPMTLARADAGVNLPSTALPAEAAPAPTPSAEGTPAPSAIADVARSAAVRHSGSRPPQHEATAASGVAEMAVGSTQVVARTGQQRTTGDGRATAQSNSANPRTARSPVAVTSLAAAGAAESPVVPNVASAEGRGEAMPTLDARASAAREGGALSAVAEQPTAGAGPAGSSGAPGAVEAALTSRMTRTELSATAVAGGGAPKPGRMIGGQLTPDAAVQPTAAAVVAASGDQSDAAASIRAPVRGADRHVAGLPGNLQSQPMSGAMAALTDRGAPVAEAAARRNVASQPEPGENAVAPTRTVTMNRSDSGVNLPTAAAETEKMPEMGTGGVAAAQEPSPSVLEVGPSATVRQAAADVAVSQTTAASADAETGLGSAEVVALAGKAREVGEAMPTASGSRSAPVVDRTPAADLAADATAQAEPAVRQLAGGPEAAAASGPPVGAPASEAVAREAGGGVTGGPTESAGGLAGPEGSAVSVARMSRAAREDAVPGATAAGALAGPRRTMGAMESLGASDAAAEMSEPGPSAGGFDAAAELAAEEDVYRRRQMAGLSGRMMEGMAVDGALQAGPAATTPGATRGQRRLPQGDLPGPSLAAEIGRGPVRTTDAPGLPRGASEAIAEEPVASTSSARPGEALVAAEGTAPGEPRREEGGLPVQIAAMTGPGGLSHDPLLDLGLPSRQARRESEMVHTVSRRFVIERSGGQLAIDGRVREEPAKAFRQRDVGRRSQAAQTRGGTVGTEKAVEMGLDFFARTQFPDGHWSLHELPPGLGYEDDGLAQMRSDSAATGLALLTYLGAGYTHLDEKHRGVVDRGIDWLLRNQNEDGDLFGKVRGTSYAWFYSHGIATIALCEAYGMTKDPKLREPARKAVQFILDTQHAERGGWRYRPGRETDTSVTGWQMMALKSAQMAGIEVPQEAFAKIDHWLDLSENPGGDGRYVYNPYAANTPDQRQGRRPNQAMTAEAMLMRMYLGRPSDDPKLLAGADYLKENLPSVGTRDQSLRDCYYWYYATQAMFQMQGDYWNAWNDHLRPLAEESQEQQGPTSGSWHPHKPVPDRWGRAGGRHYVTALHLLMLEVYYRHLPLFQELAK